MPHEMSCEGWVLHRRSSPVTHDFRYRVWMLFLDLDKVADGKLYRGWLPVSADRGHTLTRTEVEDHLRMQGFLDNVDRVFVLTQPRTIGGSFNPVNFYFCYQANELTHILADINNTPWDEKHCYVLEVATSGSENIEFEFPKSFHVSPFLSMAGRYRWRFALSDSSLKVEMGVEEEATEIFFAGLYLHARRLSHGHVVAGFFKYPAQNLRTLARIYWQAFRLYLKRVPFHPHPKNAPRRVEA